MDRYLVESPHEAGDCDAIIKEIHAAGYLHHFEWGCHDGAHCGWAIIETDNREHARQIVPWRIRNKARIIKLETFGRANKTSRDKMMRIAIQVIRKIFNWRDRQNIESTGRINMR